ncbi:PREDICTED: uncharacterized protein LOC109231667 [Nicotiana attenuata]|uniref:uncharacterized protein LOC109231667 n=1 Tax=Nicotiana attenuata TaxID=49451 RepID=UPI000905217E|nr:PREDICTED: uncharacterized protein LOC109231667 [Nicotiana attenuata]
MTRASAKEVLPYEPELEKQPREVRKERDLTEKLVKVGQSSTQTTMAGNDDDNFRNIALGLGRSLGDYARLVYNKGLSNVRPSPIAANNFELKQGLLQTIQNCCVFREKMNEDPNIHLMDFEEIMNTFQYNGVSQDVVYLRAFPFSLKDDVKQWIRILPTGPIRTWDEMTRTFLDKYFSSAMTDKFRREIHNFCQKETETVFEACERFNEIDGLTSASHRTLSNTTGGPLMRKTPKEIVTILDELSEDANQRHSDSAERRRSIGIHQVDVNTSVQKQNNPRFQGQVAPSFINQPRQQFQPQQPNQPSLEDLLKSFIVKTNERFEVQVAAIQNLEKQVGQIAAIFSERVPGTLLADTDKNPKETINVVALRSGQVLNDLTPIQKDMKLEKKSGEQLKGNVDKKKKVQMAFEKKKNEETSRREEPNERKHMLALPFPQKVYREKLDKQFEGLLDVLKQVDENLPFIEVVSQMLAFAKFLKEILIEKREIMETSAVKLRALKHDITK